MKLVAILCLSVVLYVDSVNGLTFNEFLSYIPGWDAIVATWDHIKEAIKRPVKIKRWDRVKQRKTTTSPNATTSVKTTTTSTPLIRKSTWFAYNTMKTRHNATRGKTTQLNSISHIHNLTTNTLHITSVLTPRKSIVPLILPSFGNRPVKTSVKPLLSLVDLAATRTKSSLTSVSSTTAKSVLTVRSRNRLSTPAMYVQTSFKTPITSTFAVSTTSTPDAVKSKRQFTYSVKPVFATDQPDMTSPDDFAIISASNEVRVSVPYISSPVFKSAEDWHRLQSMPFASALTDKEAENGATESMVVEGTDEKKGLSDTKKYSFGSLVFI